MNSNLRDYLGTPGSFWQIDREERNAVAKLLVLISQPGNLRSFVDACQWPVDDLERAEVGVEWTYSRDLWASASGPTADQSKLRSAILGILRPSDATLATCAELDFNRRFGAVPNPSATFIQSPSNWSISRFHGSIHDNDEFLRTCIYKWAFNIKPDLVVQVGERVLCVEAKWDSGEGSYPSSESEKAIFRERGIGQIGQTEVQRFLVNDLLGFEGTFVYLTRAREQSKGDALGTRNVTWDDLRGKLDISSAPVYIRDWWSARLPLG